MKTLNLNWTERKQIPMIMLACVLIWASPSMAAAADQCGKERLSLLPYANYLTYQHAGEGSNCKTDGALEPMRTILQAQRGAGGSQAVPAEGAEQAGWHSQDDMRIEPAFQAGEAAADPAGKETVHISSWTDRPSLPVAPEPLIYQVNRGDTLYQIARAFHVSVETLTQYNGLKDPNLLMTGQKLMIPAAVSASVPGEHQIVKVLNSTLTAYTAGPESTGKDPSHPAYGITFSGARVKEGHTIAVDPAVIPLGTQVYIEGIGIRTAEDIGSAIKGNRIDVYIPDLQEAIQFGIKKDVKVYVLSDS